MIRRLIAVLLIVLGLGTVGAAIASATVWKPDTLQTVPLPSQPAVNYVITDPGVLGIVNPSVKVRAYTQDADAPVFLAMGRADEVQAWVAASDHGKITGLEVWEELLYTTVDAVVDPDAKDDDAELETNPATSDMWLTQVNGIGEVTYTWEEIPGRWSMLVATDGDSPAPMVEFTWEREVPTPALIPGIILGGVLIAIGLLLAIAARIRTKALAAQAAAAPAPELAPEPTRADDDELAPVEEIMAAVEAGAADEEAIMDAAAYATAASGNLDAEYPHLTADTPEDPARPLTRREIRERERLREREAALAGATDEDDRPWPTQETPVVPSGRREAAQRRWWQRKAEAGAAQAPATGPIIIDEDTGEIIITGEIDLSALTPQASADSWRATWGLDKNTPTRWVPVMKEPEGEERDE